MDVVEFVYLLQGDDALRLFVPAAAILEFTLELAAEKGEGVENKKRGSIPPLFNGQGC